MKWGCESGRLVVEVSTDRRPLVDATCPGTDIGYATETGPISLEIKGDGPWQLQIEQQIDVPLEEPPLPAMIAPGTVRVATGSFYNIDQAGRGGVTIYRLADDGYALRLEDFFVTPNVDLEIRLSPLAAPQTTEEFLSAPSALVTVLDTTAGSMNFAVPGPVDPTQYRSVVVWCPPVLSAYAAASLAPPQ
ncbi:MAG TPA: DM13 domain-containing protein [Egibacteraceae bacterium]|nr:DM13 domain-containing protein [Egibacteraceae bacterium]